MTARDFALTSDVDCASQVGLQSGTQPNPVVPPDDGEVRFIDYTRSEELRAYLRDYPDRVASILQVSVVWPGRELLVDLFDEDARFDYAIASRAIQLIRSVLGWFPRLLRGAESRAASSTCPYRTRGTLLTSTSNLRTISELPEADALDFNTLSIRQMHDHTLSVMAINSPGETWFSGVESNMFR